MTLSWGQYCNGFTIEEIDKATKNVLLLKEKIIQLNEKCLLNDTNKDKINDLIERLEMSKNCIKYYYGLSINI